jgi:hypothetical protein
MNAQGVPIECSYSASHDQFPDGYAVLVSWHGVWEVRDCYCKEGYEPIVPGGGGGYNGETRITGCRPK